MRLFFYNGMIMAESTARACMSQKGFSPQVQEMVIMAAEDWEVAEPGPRGGKYIRNKKTGQRKPGTLPVMDSKKTVPLVESEVSSGKRKSKKSRGSFGLTAAQLEQIRTLSTSCDNKRAASTTGNKQTQPAPVREYHSTTQQTIDIKQREVNAERAVNDIKPSSNITAVINKMVNAYLKHGVKLNKDTFEDEGHYKSAEDINEGACLSFAQEVAAKVPGAKAYLDYQFDKKQNDYVDAHAFIVYNGKFYDSETPKGVANWRDLPTFKRIPVTQKDRESNRQYRQLLGI